jgi:hypothetical protein
MVDAFSALSLKRHLSSREEESIHSKVSRLKLLRFYLLSKFTNSVNSEHSNQNNGFISQPSKNKEHYHGLLKKSTESNHRHSTATAPTSSKKLKSILVNHNKSSSAVSDLTHQHYSSHMSISNMTINSEDLTAKEFASIAGIEILPEEDEQRISDDDDISILYTISSFDVGNSLMSRQSRDSTRPTRIWDPGFWQRPYHHEEEEEEEEEEDLPILNQFRSENASVIRKGRFEIYLDH